MSNFLTAIPVFNEVRHVGRVLREVLKYASDVLAVDDGSWDGTDAVLRQYPQVVTVRHPRNRGYGASLRTAFRFAIEHGYGVLVTLDCDGQHEPQRIPDFVQACSGDVDIVSGSRYLARFSGDGTPPPDRRRINQVITGELNRRLGLQLTDAFCGFKAYRVSALTKLELTDDGYAMPLELWVQAVYHGLRIVELPVPLIYLDEERSFGGSLDNADVRLAVYREVLEKSLRRVGMCRPEEACSSSALDSPNNRPS
ncbi:MAG: glycosyltransferase family 2 protein [Thermogutta sp.]|nr:glycosyltransferase family 2 protein [Thermogutta sp.]